MRAAAAHLVGFERTYRGHAPPTRAVAGYRRTGARGRGGQARPFHVGGPRRRDGGAALHGGRRCWSPVRHRTSRSERCPRAGSRPRTGGGLQGCPAGRPSAPPPARPWCSNPSPLAAAVVEPRPGSRAPCSGRADDEVPAGRGRTSVDAGVERPRPRVSTACRPGPPPSSRSRLSSAAERPEACDVEHPGLGGFGVGTRRPAGLGPPRGAREADVLRGAASIVEQGRTPGPLGGGCGRGGDLVTCLPAGVTGLASRIFCGSTPWAGVRR